MKMNLKDLIDTAPSRVRNSFIFKKYKRGKSILLPNKNNEYLYLLTNGKAEVYREDYSGALISVYNYNNYSLFGELELFNENIITFGITAKTDCEIILVHKNSVFEWMKIDFNFTRYILEQLALKLASSSYATLRLSLLSLKDRILYSIYIHNKIGDLNDLTKEKLSQEVYAPIRSINRSIKECIEEGFITYKDKRFYITETDKLEEYSKVFVF